MTVSISNMQNINNILTKELENEFARALSLYQDGQLADAEEIYKKILKQQPRHFDSLQLSGMIALQGGEAELAVKFFQQAIEINPNVAAICNNLGCALAQLSFYEEALANYQRAIALQADSVEAYNNLAGLLKKQARFSEALVVYEQALAIAPDFLPANIEYAKVLEQFDRLDEALVCYQKALSFSTQEKFLLGDYLHLKARLCDWDALDSQLRSSLSMLLSYQQVFIPIAAIHLLSSLQAHQVVANVFLDAEYSKDNPPYEYVNPHAEKRIRLAYYSADFDDQATYQLVTELLAQHDRERFELYAFYFGTTADSGMHNRLASAFDHFLYAKDANDSELVQLSRNLKIDIAVDLMGYTYRSRPGIFAERCAPIQVSYFGYPGTLGGDLMDYIIADKTVMPVEDHSYFSEKVIYLPYSYQASPSSKNLSILNVDRKTERLPESGVVFCCFNGAHKIMPATFDVWMRILKAVEGSVLWLAAPHPIAIKNLRQEAESRGVDADRLVFAGYVPHEEHLARHRLADVFLDTLPHNAHTAASDALWVGLPVLTCQGRSFPGRLAASLLKTLGMPELITLNYQDYEAKAIELANFPERLQALKAKLEQNCQASPLFNARSFARHIEAAYEAIYARYLAGLSPDLIEVEEISL